MARYMKRIETDHIYPWTPQLEKKPGFKEIDDPFVVKEPTAPVVPVEVNDEEAGQWRGSEEVTERPVEKAIWQAGRKRQETKQARATRRGK